MLLKHVHSSVHQIDSIMKLNAKDLYTDFDATSENQAEKIAVLVRALSIKTSESGGKRNTLHIQDKRNKKSFAKRMLCCLKIF